MDYLNNLPSAEAIINELERRVLNKRRMTNSKPSISIPKKYKEVWNSDATFIVLKGGRGSGKTVSMMLKIIQQIVNSPETFNVLFLREFLKNVKDTKDLFIDLANQLNITFQSRGNELKYKNKLIYFRGAREPTTTSTTRMLATLNQLKNIPNLRYIMVDEAQDTAENTLDVLVPTARSVKLGDRTATPPRFIFCMNPKTENAPVLAFVQRRPENSIILHSNIYDIEEKFQNAASLKEAEYSRQYDTREKYEHIWLGRGSPLIKNPFAQIEIIPQLPTSKWERFYAWCDPAFVGYNKAYTAICGLVKLENDSNFYIFGELYDGAWHSHMKQIYEFATKDLRWMYSNIQGTTTVYYESNSIGTHLRKIYNTYSKGEYTIVPVQTLGNKEVKIMSKSYLHGDIKLVRDLSHEGFIKNVLEYEAGAKSKIDGIDAMCSLLEHLGL